jgi:hypothetical protein
MTDEPLKPHLKDCYTFGWYILCPVTGKRFMERRNTVYLKTHCCPHCGEKLTRKNSGLRANFWKYDKEGKK